jgi:hypothetical protein
MSGVLVLGSCTGSTAIASRIKSKKLNYLCAQLIKHHAMKTYGEVEV